MHEATQRIAVEAGWRLKTLMRTRRFHNRRALVKLYKSQVLSYIESSTPTIAHAAATLLSAIDSVQNRFLREIEIEPVDAMREFALAPLQVRRDIAMLGVIHRAARGEGPAQFRELFPFIGCVVRNRWTQVSSARRNMQVFERYRFRSTDIIRRSAFGLVPVYNLLPQKVVKCTVRRFQRHLQQAVFRRASSNPASNWQFFLRDASAQMSIRKFQDHF